MKRNIFFAHNSRFGFSLVEIIVATLLLALITAGILSVSLSSRNVIQRSHSRNTAYQIAEAVAENLRNYLGYNHWNTTSPLSANQTYGPYSLSAGDPLNVSWYFGNTALAGRNNARYSYEVTDGFTGCGGLGDACQYRKVVINVTWDEDKPQ